MDVLKFTKYEQVPQADVIALLEETLEMAKAGEIRAVALATQIERNQTSSAFAMGDGDMAHLMLALERVKLRLLEVK